MDQAARQEIDERIAQLLNQVADDVTRDARRFAPIRTGKMRNSINKEPVQGNSIIVRASAEYAGYVELGTRYMAPQPYLRPAVYRKRGG